MSFFHPLPKDLVIENVTVKGGSNLLIETKRLLDSSYRYSYYVSKEGVSIHESASEAKLFIEGRSSLSITNIEKDSQKKIELLSFFEKKGKQTLWGKEEPNELRILKLFLQREKKRI